MECKNIASPHTRAEQYGKTNPSYCHYFYRLQYDSLKVEMILFLSHFIFTENRTTVRYKFTLIHFTRIKTIAAPAIRILRDLDNICN